MKQRLLWILYDGFNSIIIIIGAVYFTKWLIADAGVPDSAVAITVSLASIVFIFIAPRFGATLVSEAKVYRALFWTTIAVGILATTLGFPGLLAEPTQVALGAALLGFFFLNLLYQLSLIAYNCYLPVLVGSHEIERYSGFGEASGQIGSVIGIIIALALLSLNPWGWLSGSTVRMFLLIGPFVLILLIIAVMGMRNSNNRLGSLTIENKVHEPVIWALLKRNRSFALLIFVVFLYNNAFATLQVFSSSYLAIAWGWPEKQIGLGLLTTLLGAGLGGYAASRCENRMPLGRQLRMGTVVFAVSVTGLAIASVDWLRFLSLTGGGLGFGFLAATARAATVLLAAELPVGSKFGVYGAVSRTSAIVGPLLWAGVIFLLSDANPALARQVAMGVLAGVAWIAVGVVVLSSLGTVSRSADT